MTDKIQKITRQALVDFLKDYDPYAGTKIYLGCDSERLMKEGVAYADYQLVVVIHKNGNNGCKIFGEVVREMDHDKRSNPKMRLVTEALKVSELYLKYADIFDDYEVEIHLDLNPDEEHKSSEVIKEACGYVKGMCNIDAKVKNVAFAASYAADRLKEISNMQKEPAFANWKKRK